MAAICKGSDYIQKLDTVWWSSLHYNDWIMHLAATANGLCCVTLPNESFDVMVRFISRQISNVNLERNDLALEIYMNELRQFLEGSRTEFSIPLDLRGTSFQIAVWNSLLTIPYGQTVAYADIAKQIGKPSAVRAVGAAIGANPIPFIIPCHRVLGKNGTLTGYRGGLQLKSALLQLEGIGLSQSTGSISFKNKVIKQKPRKP